MAQICDEFKRIALKHKYASKAQLRGMWIRYNDFSVEARTAVKSKVIGRARRYIMKKYQTVWDVIGGASYWTVVFYYTEKDVIENQNNGVSEMIAGNYYSLLKEHDELHFFTRDNMGLKFDSKENVDKNYKGNLFHYFR
jgi:hypothetical protein